MFTVKISTIIIITGIRRLELQRLQRQHAELFLFIYNARLNELKHGIREGKSTSIFSFGRHYIPYRTRALRVR